MPAETARRARQREVEVWIARVRLGAVVFAVVEVGVFTTDYPEGYESLAWIITAAFAFGAFVLFFASRTLNVGVVGCSQP